MTTAGLVHVVSAVATVAVAGRTVIPMLDRRRAEVVCEVGALAVLVLVVAGPLPLVWRPDPGVGVDGGGTGVLR